MEYSLGSAFMLSFSSLPFLGNLERGVWEKRRIVEGDGRIERLQIYCLAERRRRFIEAIVNFVWCNECAFEVYIEGSFGYSYCR